MRKKLLVLAGVVVVAAGGAAAWWLLRPAEATTSPVVVPVTVGTQRQTVSASGTVEPSERADLSFGVAGEVTEVLVKEGDTVTAGQALAKIDDTLLQAQLTAAQAQLEAVEDQAADSDDASADAAVVSAESDVAAAQEAVAQATLTAPMAGTVAAVDLAVGDRVGTTQQTGSEDTQAQVTVVSTGTFVVEANVSAADAARVKQGLAAEITPVGADEPVEGTVRTVGLVAEADSSGAATFPVTVDVTGKRDDLYAGSSATVVVVVSERENVLTVPAMALHTEDGTTYVNKVVDGTAVRTEVEVGESFGMQTEITAGLAEGDQVEVQATVQTRAPGGGGGGGGDTVFPGGGGGGPMGGPMIIQGGGGR
ncbi:MAG: biotin/lipoyl-binding protein [Actinomycetota bacterium]|nr:biotin/lipoyl-binding protein [Actinomycetota bacterium]